MSTPDKPPLLVLVGPTAVGKTALAVELALHMCGEVVTADSMQVYRGLDVGTAKPTIAEMRGVPHHLIDVADPSEAFNVARYRDLARQCIAEVHQRGNLPILSGGTGLYIKAVLSEFLFPDTGAEPQIRAALAAEAEQGGAAALHARLARVDPASAARLHPNDVRRVIRALELYQRTGVPMSEHLARAAAAQPPYRVASVGLTRSREHLYERINQRVLQLVENGLVEETKQLLSAGYLEDGTVAGQALGYKEMRDYVEGRCDLATAIDNLQQATRHYAKRQYTWFRRDSGIKWFNLDLFTTLADAAQAVADYCRQTLSWTAVGPPKA